MSEKISEHFTLEELIYSDTAKIKGINNTPNETQKKVLKHTAEYFLEPLRKLLNEHYKIYNNKKIDHVGIKITSGYRCLKLNTLIGSKDTSQHIKGEACDMEAIIYFTDGIKTKLPYIELYNFIKQSVKLNKLSVDQLIQEKSGDAVWVHASYSSWGSSKNRKQFLKYFNSKYIADLS